MSSRHSLYLAAVLLFAGAAGVQANGPSFGSARGTSIIGNAWTSENSPIKNARLRLRNVTTGRIEATTVANEAGQFTFANIEGGAYVVEMVNESGKILTVGHVFNIAPGETMGTFVRLGTKVPWFTGFFSNTAAAAASSAASQGITALAPVVREATISR